MHIKKQKGSIGLTKTIAQIVEQEYNVSIPIQDHLKYDLIVENCGKCYTVQVRFSSANNGIMKIKLRSVWSNKKGVHVKNRKHGDFDILAVYCPQTNDVYFIADNEFEAGNSLSLRIRESETTNPAIKKQARMASDYKKLSRVFEKLGALAESG